MESTGPNYLGPIVGRITRGTSGVAVERYEEARMLQRSDSFLGAVLLALTMWTSSGWASTFSAFAGPVIVQNSSTPVFVFNYNTTLGLFDATARADASVGAEAKAFAQGAGPFTPIFAQQSASGRSSIDDIIFKGPGATVNATITLPFHMEFLRYHEEWDAFTGLSSSTDQTFTISFGGSNIQNFDTIDGDFTSAQEVPTISFQHIPNNPAVAFSFTKIFEDDVFMTAVIDGKAAAGIGRDEGFYLSGAVTLQQTFPVGVPLLLNLQLSTTDTAQALYITSASGVTAGMQTFGIPTGVSAFDLPPGYTVNAESIGLVDGVVPDASSPEPGTVLLFSAGCLVMMARSRSISRRATPEQ
jgi:hypothetical protein